MQPLSTEQLERLQEGCEIGIFSKVKLEKILAQHSKAAQIKSRERAAILREMTNDKNKFDQAPIISERTQEIRALELSIKRYKNELKTRQDGHESDENKTRVVFLKRTICEQKSDIIMLYMLKTPVAKPPYFPPTQLVERLRLLSVPDKNRPVTDLEAALHKNASDAIYLIMKIHALASELQLAPVSNRQRSSTRINAKDAELCLYWNNTALPQIDSSENLIWDRLKEVVRYRQCQLLSARSAELVMKNYYKKLGFNVEDVSLQQIDPVSDDWKFFDLKVGDRYIDVKNARESFNGQGHFVEHCVPKFKQDRITGEHIAIAGVLSTYISDPSDYRYHSTIAIVLGEVNILDVKNLCQWAHDRFGTQLDLAGIWKENFLPGWLFEYPPEHYPHRMNAIDAIAHLAWRLIDNGAFGNRLPGWLLVLCKDDALIRSLPLDERKRKIVNDLRSMLATAGLTRRSLYVYVMGLSIENLVKGLSPIEDLNTLLELIKLPCEDKSTYSVLGLQDPLDYVKFIIETMSAVSIKLLDSKIILIGFKLTHPAILKGVRADGTYLTLLAYCGGWQDVPVRVKCGATPLVIFENELCPGCGRLICNKCDHCWDSCSLCKTRQFKLASDTAGRRFFKYDSRRS